MIERMPISLSFPKSRRIRVGITEDISYINNTTSDQSCNITSFKMIDTSMKH